MDVMSRFCFLFFIFNVSYYKKCEWKYSYTSHQLVFCDTCITDSNSKTRQNTNTPTSSCWLCVFVTVHPPMILELWKLDPLYSVEMQLPLGGLERWPLPTVHDCRSWRLLRPECLADACTMNALSSYMTLNIHKILQHCAHYPNKVTCQSINQWSGDPVTYWPDLALVGRDLPYVDADEDGLHSHTDLTDLTSSHDTRRHIIITVIRYTDVTQTSRRASMVTDSRWLGQCYHQIKINYTENTTKIFLNSGIITV